MARAIDSIVTGLDDLVTSSTETTSREVGGDLGKEEFLQLLVTQMKNQDPLEPEKDTDFIAQLAQFSALEQMQNLNETATNSQAFGLVGKSVILNTTSANGQVNEVSGVVDYITMKNGKAQLSINGQLYSIDDLVTVKDSYYAIQEFLPSVEKTEVTYDKSNKKPVDININLGQGDYAATSVAVVMNGDYVNADYLTYDDGVLSIWPDAFENLGIGEYEIGLYFDDPYNTVIKDKVVIKVVDGE
ncbi:MAG: hypothetical protein NC293_08475 [Roseburia sp.]|nr:hypothetical protein [Roseburia sp.]